MKKSMFIGILLAALAVFGFVGAVSAQGPTQPEVAPGNGYMHDYLVAYAAEAFGMSVADLEARLDAGETLAQIALTEGFDDFTTFMQDAREYVREQLAADGITIPGWGRGMGMGGYRAQQAGQFGACTALDADGNPLQQMIGRGYRGGK